MDPQTPPQPLVTASPVVSTPMPQPQALPPTPPPPPTPNILKHKKALIVTGVLIVVLFFSGILAFIVGYNTYTNPSPTPEATPGVVQTPPPIETPQPLQTPVESTPQAPGGTEEVTKIITPLPSFDGYHSSNGSGNNDAEIRAGRNAFLISRGFSGFDISTIPRRATIESATLRIFQTGIDGNPYGVGGDLKVDHVDLGSALDYSDYSSSPLATNVGTLTTNDEVGWKEITVTEAVKQDLLNSRTRSSFRLHFTKEAVAKGSGGDFAYFESAENYVGSGNIPQLIIKYRE